MADLLVDIVPYFNDNYCYLVHDGETAETALFDCGDAKPVIQRLRDNGWNLTMVCVTHFHADHAGGLGELTQAFPEAQVIIPAGEGRLSVSGTEVADGETIAFGNRNIKAISVPAHTKCCTSYFIEGRLFVGDTLFSGGCGRLFEGQALDLEKAMAKLSSYPDDTEIYHGHEYTLSNLEFAKTVEPNNQKLLDYLGQVKEKQRNGEYTTPTILSREKQINPFLRVDQAAIIDTVDPEGKLSRTERLGLIRSKKDSF